jgi:hypothetical protein
MFEEIMRPFWLNGLNTITGKLPSKLIEVIEEKKKYVIYDKITQHEFKLTITDYSSFLKGYASDINRFGCAALESIINIQYKNSLKNAHAWNCIKSYYAAYYAAHAFLRILGISCTNFEQVSINSVESIADIYDNRDGINITKGYYQCRLDFSTKQLVCSKISQNGNKGSHEQLWGIYLQTIDSLINEIKNKSTNPVIQSTISKFTDLRNALTYLGSNGGNWLSKVRNEINYKHSNGLWFPYKESEKYFTSIEKLLENWNKNPESIDLSIYYDKPILKYLNTCIFIVSLYLSMAKEMSERCPKGKSFHQSGVLSLVNRINNRSSPHFI